MKTITINVSEPIYEAFQLFARLRGRTASELIREAMEAFWAERIRARTDLRNWNPVSLGSIKQPLGSDDDLLGEMLSHGEGAGAGN